MLTQTTKNHALSVVSWGRDMLQQESKNLLRLWEKWTGVY